MDKRQEKYFKRLKNCVSEKRGKCLSNIYVDCKTELKFQCSEGHIWKTKPTNITCHGNWCYVCSKNKQRTNINDIIKIVQNKGGELLTKEYKNCKQKLKIKCSKEHIWDMSYRFLSEKTPWLALGMNQT